MLMATHASQQNEEPVQDPSTPEPLLDKQASKLVLSLVLIESCRVLIRKQSDNSKKVRDVVLVSKVVKRCCS